MQTAAAHLHLNGDADVEALLIHVRVATKIFYWLESECTDTACMTVDND